MKLLRRLLTLLCLLATQYALAESTVYPIVTYTCDSVGNILKIKNEVKWDDDGRNFKFSPADGVYNPWDWVTIEKIADGNARLVTARAPLVLYCKLGREVYKVVLEPKIFNRNYDGSCGNRLSIIVSIYRGSDLLLDHKEFESYCHGNAPVVRGIKLEAGSADIKIVTIPKFEFY